MTSQIFANIYLNEFDRFIKHKLGVRYYLRYGDDFVIICENREELYKIKELAINFLQRELKLAINKKNDIIIDIGKGIKFLGVEIWPNGRRLKKRNIKRIDERLSWNNVCSYSGLVDKHGNIKLKKYLNWKISEILR